MTRKRLLITGLILVLASPARSQYNSFNIALSPNSLDSLIANLSKAKSDEALLAGATAPASRSHTEGRQAGRKRVSNNIANPKSII